MAREPRELVTIPDADPIQKYTVTGTPNDTFAFNFPYWDPDEIVVRTAPVGTDTWSVRLDLSINAVTGFAQTGYASGEVVFNAPVIDVEVCITRYGVFDRIAQFQPGVAVDVYALNRDLNRLVGLLQSLRMRALLLNPCDQNQDGVVAIDPIDGPVIIPIPDPLNLPSVNAGVGLTGGGDLDLGDVTVDLDISTLPAQSEGEVAVTDGYLVDDGGAMKRVAYQDVHLSLISRAGTTDTLASADCNSMIRYTAATAVTVTLPTSVGGIGSVIQIMQYGAGQVEVVASGTTIRAPNGAKTAAQYSIIVLICVAANEWVIGGDSVA